MIEWKFRRLNTYPELIKKKIDEEINHQIHICTVQFVDNFVAHDSVNRYFNFVTYNWSKRNYFFMKFSHTQNYYSLILAQNMLNEFNLFIRKFFAGVASIVRLDGLRYTISIEKDLVLKLWWAFQTSWMIYLYWMFIVLMNEFPLNIPLSPVNSSKLIAIT